MTTAAPTPHGRTAETVGEKFWREELAQYLTAAVFPADQDELQAALIRHRAPSRLLWHLAPLSPWRQYSSLTEVLDDLDAPTSTGAASERF